MPLHAASKLFQGPFDEKVVRETARELRQELGAEPTFGIVFASPDYLPQINDFLETVRLHGHLPLLVGGTGYGLTGQNREMENQPGFSLLFFHLPGCTVQATSVSSSVAEETTGAVAWRRLTGIAPEQVKGWMVLGDPFDFPIDHWMQQWNEAYPAIPTFGGLVSGLPSANEAWLFLNGETVDGAILVSFAGAIDIHTVVSQGCKPIGEPYTITSVDQNVLYTLGSQPAYKILDGAFQALTDSEKEKARGHLFAGLAMSEYIEDFKRGDFLVRSILGADPNTGAVAISARPRVGQTLQYQLRDPEAASSDLHQLLTAKQEELKETPPFAAFLCTCNGRGQALFGEIDHDPKAIDSHFPGVPSAGFFANGEIGPVGPHSYVHGYTASIALFCPVAEK